jgi:hypothetical protein
MNLAFDDAGGGNDSFGDLSADRELSPRKSHFSPTGVKSII